MALTAKMIKDQLSKGKSITKDNIAQKLIKNATPTDIRALEVESILRLYEALMMLAPRIISANDAAALKKLKTYCKFQAITNTPNAAINILRKKYVGTVGAKTVSVDLVKRLYAAEKSRLSFLENIGIDGKTIGRGQLGQSSYEDIKGGLPTKNAWKEYFTRIAMSDLLSGKKSEASRSIKVQKYSVIVPSKYDSIITSSKPLEDFIVTAYLFNRIERSERAGRSDEDATKIGVALYHGMYPMMRKAQKKLKSTTHWKPLEAELLKSGHSDEVNYINEVVQ